MPSPLGCRAVLVAISFVLIVSGQSKRSAEIRQADASALPIQTKIHLGGDPDWMSAGFGSLWVSVPKNNEIVRINPANNTVVARIKVSDEPCYGIGIGTTHVWVLTCKGQKLTRIRPWDNTADQATAVRVAPHGEGAVAISQGSVWFVADGDGHSDRLSRFCNGATRNLKVGADSAVVTAGFGSIWVTSSGPGIVYRVDPGSLKITAKISVPPTPRFTAIGSGSVWVLSQKDGVVSRIDPRRNKVVASVAAGIPGAGGDIAYGGGYIWAAGAGTPLTQIDPRSNRVLRQFGNYKGADAVRFAFGSIWISDHGKGDVWRIDPDQLSPAR